MSEARIGPWVRPVNISADAAGSIHDDATAQSLGLRGGTVAGSLHMEAATPLCVAHFGEAWLVRGGLSLFFLSPTRGGEPVRTVLGPLEAGEGIVRASALLEAEDGAKVAEGTASLGPDATSALRHKLMAARPAQDIRMLADVRVDATCSDIPVSVDPARLARHLGQCSGVLPAHEKGALTANLAIDALRSVEPQLAPVRGAFVGLYGAIELQMLAGPLLAGREYLARGRVLALGETPKTEALWYEAVLTDVKTGMDAAQMLMMTRLMKGSSPLWA